MGRGGNPLMKTPCGECKQKQRHADTCSKKRSSGPRGMTVERAKALIAKMPDETFGEVVAFVSQEVMDRRNRIAAEAKERLLRLDAILRPPSIPHDNEERTFLDDVTTRAAAVEATRAGTAPRPVPLPTREVPPTPKALQCPAINPTDVTLKCTQPKNHEGQHWNHKARQGWMKR